MLLTGMGMEIASGGTDGDKCSSLCRALVSKMRNNRKTLLVPAQSPGLIVTSMTLMCQTKI